MTPVADAHTAERRHVRVCREENWGECPPSPHWHCVPIFGDGYQVKAADPKFRPASYIGGWRRSVHLSHFQRVRGVWRVLLYPEVAAFLLDMALERTGGELHSHCIDHYTPSDPRRHLGCVVEGATLRCDARTGAALWRMALRGKCEQENDALGEDDFDYSSLTLVPFGFDGATLDVDGSAVTDVERFTVSVVNNVLCGPSIAGQAAYLSAGQRTVSLRLTKLNDSDLFNSAIRSGGTISFSASLGHPAGWTLDLELPRLCVDESRERATPGELVTATPVLEAGVDEAGVDISYQVTGPP